MAYTPKEGQGALFKNDKGDNPARPDYRGDIYLGGVLYEVSGWIKPLPSDSEKRFMSLSGKPKTQGQGSAPPPSRRPPPPSRNGYAERDDPPF